MNPHAPFHPQTAIDVETDADSEQLSEINDRFTAGDATALASEEMELMRSLHRGNVRYLDRHLSKLLDWAASQQWYSEALVIIVADHGELFGEHGRSFHSWDCQPLITSMKPPCVKLPMGKFAGRPFEHLVEHISVYNAMLDVTPADDRCPHVDADSQNVISLSNTYKRLTTVDGSLVIDNDGSESVEGDFTDSERETLRSQAL